MRPLTSHILSGVLGILVLCVSACSRTEAARSAAPPSTTVSAPPPEVFAEPALRPDPRACAASVAEAQDGGQHPERLSVQIQPPPYRRTRDPAELQRYLDTIEPGRVFQTADPASGAMQLTLVGSGATTVIPRLGSATLAVRTVPDAPCTFLATEGGAFAETGLACATVQANADGIARATYRADAGTIDDATILIGSPEAVGTQTLIVHVHHPESFMPAPAASSTTH